MVAAWVAEHDGEIAGHAALLRGMSVECLLRATGAGAAVEHGLQPVLDVVDDSEPAIALYERAGWQLVGTQLATWTDPDGSVPVIRCYVQP